MHIVYIEFGVSKSKKYKRACNLAKGMPNYNLDKDTNIIKFWIDEVFDYIKFQIQIMELIDIIKNWKNSNILLYENSYSGSFDCYDFMDKLKSQAGKYRNLIMKCDSLNVSLGAVTYEQLPLPIVYYPELYGTFFAFSQDVGEKIYFCECERQAIENYIKLRKQNPLENYDNSKAYPLGSDCFPEQVSKMSLENPTDPLSIFGFKENLCFKCNGTVPLMKYCHPMYGGTFQQKFGWYINQEWYKLGVDKNQIWKKNILPNLCTPELYDYTLRYYQARENCKYGDNCDEFISIEKSMSKIIENKVREELGYPKIGDAWVSETLLFHIVESIFPNIEIKRHYRPKWLDGLELDIFLPSENLGFEYQGIQHFKAVEHWGGEKQLEIQKEHDSRKKKICAERGISLICVDYDENLTVEYISSKIRNALG